jgi:hypothetical protein
MIIVYMMNGMDMKYRGAGYAFFEGQNQSILPLREGITRSSIFHIQWMDCKYCLSSY